LDVNIKFPGIDV